MPSNAVKSHGPPGPSVKVGRARQSGGPSRAPTPTLCIQHLPPPSAQPERMNVKKLAEAAQGYAAVPRAAPQLSMEI
jgi:hypothetical protein